MTKRDVRALGLLSFTLLLLGCSDEAVDQGSDQDNVTWYRDVLPVVQDNCVSCHNDDAATFSMSTFGDDVVQRAALMASYTSEGVMPPWKPTSECNSYVGERHLTQAQIDLFAAWADGGAKMGDPADAPAALPPLVGLDWIDRSMEMDAAYTPAPLANDPMNDIHCFVLDPELTQDELLIGVDVVPGETRVVHHVLLYLVDGAEADVLDAADPDVGYSCFGGPGATSAKVLSGWVPGSPANRYPTSTGLPLGAGSKIIMQIHYNVTQAGPLPDQTNVELQFAQEPMENAALIMSMTENDFQIPPQTDGYSAEVSTDVPQRATVWAVAPHMHLLGKRARIEVQRANGDTECLVDIPQWDFNWQQFYFFDSPVGVQLEAGDKVSLTCTWDNTLNKTVGWGDGTEDEMCVSYLYVTAGWAQ
jgi:hypothetical protein